MKCNLVKICSFTEVITGGTPSTKVKEYWNNGNIPWLNSGDLNQGIIDSASNFITELGLKNSSTRLMPPDTVLIALTGATTGVTAFLNIEACANQSVTGILPSKSHNPQYLYYFLKTQREKILRKTWGGAQPHINQKYVKDYLVPLPPLPDQIRIANILSKAEELISERKQSIKLLDDYLKSAFIDMFGDPFKNEKGFKITELEKLCTEIVDCPHSTPKKSDVKTIYPCIRTSELIDGYINWKSMQYLDEDEYIVRTKRLIPQKDDIIYGREGTFGEAVILPDTHKFSLGQRTMLFRPNFTMIISIYLKAILRSDYLYSQAKRKNSGSTVGHVNVKDIKKFQILVPPIELQNKFAKMVEKTEQIKADYKQSLQELENLYGSLSKKAFGG